MTENQIPYEQEEEINLVSLLFTVLHKYRQMAAAALVCAVLFAGVAVMKNISWNAAVQKAAEEGETAPRTSAQQTYEEDMVEYREAQNKRDTDVQSYNQQLRDNERSQQTVQFNIDNAEEYMEKSVLQENKISFCGFDDDFPGVCHKLRRQNEYRRGIAVHY